MLETAPRVRIECPYSNNNNNYSTTNNFIFTLDSEAQKNSNETSRKMKHPYSHQLYLYTIPTLITGIIKKSLLA